MKITNITGTRSTICIEAEGKILKATGEMLMNGFAVDKDSITAWEPPYSKIISEKEREAIIMAVQKKAVEQGFEIIFD